MHTIEASEKTILPQEREALRQVAVAVRDALRDHKRMGNPVAAWQNGKVVWIPADEIDLPEDDAV